MKFIVVALLGLYLSLPGVCTDHVYGFYRHMQHKAKDIGTRRVFGGHTADLDVFPTTCALCKWSGKIKCTGAIVAERFVVTAAHCVTPDLRLIKYNTKNPNAGTTGETALIKALYQHPGFAVVEKDEGRGLDVTQLHHDIGLVETKTPMRLSIPIKADPLVAMGTRRDLTNKYVTVLGFGRREEDSNTLGEELYSVDLIVQECHRPGWIKCGCGAPEPGARTRGVCSGDSGGPVVLNGVQVGVTSMGPIECVTKTDPSHGSTSVFTYTSGYMDIINSTINHDPQRLKMSTIAMSSSETFLVNKCFSFIALLIAFLIN